MSMPCLRLQMINNILKGELKSRLEKIVEEMLKAKEYYDNLETYKARLQVVHRTEDLILEANHLLK